MCFLLLNCFCNRHQSQSAKLIQQKNSLFIGSSQGVCFGSVSKWKDASVLCKSLGRSVVGLHDWFYMGRMVSWICWVYPSACSVLFRFFGCLCHSFFPFLLSLMLLSALLLVSIKIDPQIWLHGCTQLPGVSWPLHYPLNTFPSLADHFFILRSFCGGLLTFFLPSLVCIIKFASKASGDKWHHKM